MLACYLARAKPSWDVSDVLELEGWSQMSLKTPWFASVHGNDKVEQKAAGLEYQSVGRTGPRRVSVKSLSSGKAELLEAITLSFAWPRLLASTWSPHLHPEDAQVISQSLSLGFLPQP